MTLNTLLPLIENTCKDGKIVHTDKWKGYNGVNSTTCFIHRTVNHSENANPQDGIHTQGIEYYGVSLRNKLRTQKR